MGAMTSQPKCALCGKPFDSFGYKHRFCSEKCRNKSYARTRWNQRAIPEPLAPRRCAHVPCNKEFQTVRSDHRFCTPRCGVKAYNLIPKAERDARRLTKAQRHPNTALFAELRAEVGPGKCIYCERRIASVKAYICHDPKCLTEYRRDYGTMRRKHAKEARPPLPERKCKCGCGASFVPAAGGQLYASAEHTRKHGRALWSAEKRRRRAEAPKGPHGPGVLFGKGRALAGRRYAAG